MFDGARGAVIANSVAPHPATRQERPLDHSPQRPRSRPAFLPATGRNHGGFPRRPTRAPTRTPACNSSRIRSPGVERPAAPWNN